MPPVVVTEILPSLLKPASSLHCTCMCVSLTAKTFGWVIEITKFDVQLLASVTTTV